MTKKTILIILITILSFNSLKAENTQKVYETLLKELNFTPEDIREVITLMPKEVLQEEITPKEIKQMREGFKMALKEMQETGIENFQNALDYGFEENKFYKIRKVEILQGLGQTEDKDTNMKFNDYLGDVMINETNKAICNDRS